jgi:DNA-binding transcriptional LysR family regulator
VQRLRRLSRLWSWLPAFRAVAETEHLPTASDELGISASALSRTIRLLEDDVGQPLFVRAGRRIELNDAGEQVLAAVRDAMRIIHEAVTAVASDRFEGAVYVSTSGVWLHTLVVPATLALHERHPKLVPHVAATPAPAIHDALLRGELDIAIVERPMPHPRLTAVVIAETPRGIYAAATHPLAGHAAVGLGDLGLHAFVAPPLRLGEAPDDGWPVDRERQVLVHVDDARAGIEVCRSGQALIVLPDALASRAAPDLRRLPTAVIPPARVFALHRPPLGPPGRTEAMLDALRGVAAGLAATGA